MTASSNGWQRWRPGRRSGLVLLVIVVALVALRIALPTIARDQINARLDRMGEYHGHVDRVGIHLWRGAYTLRQLSIVKKSGKVPVPLFSTRTLDIAISWSGLLNGGIVGKAEFDEPVLNFVDDGDSAQSQSGKGADWRAQLESIIPIRLDEVVIHRGTISFHNFGSKPPVDLRMQALEATVRNLTNVRREQGSQAATMKATAEVFGRAPVEMSAKFDPFSEPVRNFDFELQVAKLDLPQANDLVRAYAGLDIAAGTGQLNLELHAKDGHVRGYAKPLLHDLKVLSWKQDVEQDRKNPLQLAYEALAEGLTRLFTNQSQDQFGTRVPIEGEVGDAQVATLPAVFGIVRNAFIEAYKPGFDRLRENAPKSDR